MPQTLYDKSTDAVTWSVLGGERKFGAFRTLGSTTERRCSSICYKVIGYKKFSFFLGNEYLEAKFSPFYSLYLLLFPFIP